MRVRELVLFADEKRTGQSSCIRERDSEMLSRVFLWHVGYFPTVEMKRSVSEQHSAETVCSFIWSLVTHTHLIILSGMTNTD